MYFSLLYSTKRLMEKFAICIDITSDVICPWCWIGKRKLDIACEQTKDIYSFKIRWKPFQLSPNTPEKGIPLLEYIRNKYGEQSAQDIINNVSPLYTPGKSLTVYGFGFVDLSYTATLYSALNFIGLSFDKTRNIVRTMKAHLLLNFAYELGKQHELSEILFRTYFQEGKDINSDSILEQCAAEAGIEPNVIKMVQREPKAVRQYEEEIKESIQKEINGVPYFEIYVAANPSIRQQFSGAQPPETFVHVFNRLQLVAKA